MIYQKNASIISACIFLLLAFVPFNFIIGSKFAWFSCATFVVPAVAYNYSLVYVIFYIFTKALCLQHLSFLFFLHRLPLFFSTLALQRRDIKFSVLVPFVCMILFSIHPIGSQVFYYSWYWFIPMIIYWCVQDYLYARALTASFVAHAVGSVIWLYAGNIPVDMWKVLLPIVPIERLFIAIGMVCCVYIMRAIASCFEKRVIV